MTARNIRRSRSIHLLLASVASATILSGCARSAERGAPSPADPKPTRSGSASGPGTGGACQLATVDAVSNALGQTMIQVGASPDDCAYATADHTQNLLIHKISEERNMDVYLQSEAASEHIDGLGDDAFWNDTTSMIFVRKGTRAFTISDPGLSSLFPNDPDAPKRAMVQLATSGSSHF